MRHGAMRAATIAVLNEPFVRFCMHPPSSSLRCYLQSQPGWEPWRRGMQVGTSRCENE